MPSPRRLRRFELTLAALLLAVLALDFAFPLPRPAADSPTLTVLAADGTPLRSWASEDGAQRQPTTPEAVSPRYLEALLHYEDRWFRWHPGVNPVALARAAWQWARHGRIVSGGSTLTMQVARLVDDKAAGRSVPAKLRQIARALQLELHCSKREILTLYLNLAPMGGPLEGVETASRAYLGKGAAELSPAEAALLVALPQSPTRLRPDRAVQAAQAARDKVLTRMQTLHVWPAAEVADAKLERVFAPPLRARWLAPLAAERLRQQARREGKSEAVIQTTLDAGLQARLEQLLTDRLNTLPEANSMAALVVDNRTLEVRGYVGSADFGDARRGSHVDMVRAQRSPGSTLKPFLYGMALDEGLIHSESLLIDAPQNFGGYAPGNFQADFSGPVSVSEALQRSLNVPAVDLLDRLGPERFAGRLRHAGLRLRMPANAAPNLSLILGGGSTSLEELVGAYTALARGGLAGRPRLTPEAPAQEVRLMSEGAAFIVREILENGGRPGSPFRESNQRVAWKTGTSFGFRDAWALGVTDRYTFGVWVGRPDGTPNPGHFGANTSAPLLRDIAAALGPAEARQQLAPRRQPGSVRAVAICWPLGLAEAATRPDHCLQRRTAWTLDGAAPPTLPDRLQPGGLVEAAWTQGKTRVRPDCAASATPVEALRWPTLLGPFLDATQLDPVERLPWAAGCAPRTATSQALRIVGLEPGTVLRPAPGQRDVTLRLQAIGAQQGVNWLLDGQLVGSNDKAGALQLLTLQQAGAHALTALDGRGRWARVAFSLQAGAPPRASKTAAQAPMTGASPAALR
ncbi:penicillin-binding protein 1C [Roseateles saccharophilus]|uniref:peptidoglycan glycosyltransferase n=1 Tax=Roseateles saccharophilus TaxID=304 RepID=A0A4R3VBJ7_ROSSA|nr:penicillin-binding protein 1C [Roseateles saccharophilus]MDG0831596.1 penicillin-binding protein 1C [Roseateles saccharophilus]TCV00992.1 penicillin-binding protein 1C [Roseateles saccharophilus]